MKLLFWHNKQKKKILPGLQQCNLVENLYNFTRLYHISSVSSITTYQNEKSALNNIELKSICLINKDVKHMVYYEAKTLCG